MMLVSWQFPFRGQFSLSLQLQPFVAFSAVSVVMFLLCDLIIHAIFSMQL